MNIWKITHTRMKKKEKDLMNFDFLQCIFPKSTDLKANGLKNQHCFTNYLCIYKNKILFSEICQKILHCVLFEPVIM